MMKRIAVLLMVWTLALGLCACTATQLGGSGADSSQGPTWQEQYDLGIRYLSEGNYQEAIIAFTAAIEIDPKQAPAYVGRGDAYALSGETQENLVAAKVDYEKAIELDEASAEAYLGLADVYIRQGEYEKAIEVLGRGLDKTGGNKTISDRLAEMETPFDSSAEPLNEYGATNFMLREDYIDFDEMTVEQQKFVETVVVATTNGDVDALVQIRSDFSVFPSKRDNYWNIYTIWNEYKIRIHFLISSVSDVYWIDTELRTENERGYYIGYNYNEGHQYTTITVCPCVDWQWSGTMDAIFTYYTNRGELRQYLEENGPVKNGVLDGLFTSTFLTGSHVERYENGHLMERDGVSVEYDSVPTEPGRTIRSFNNQDERYW